MRSCKHGHWKKNQKGCAKCYAELNPQTVQSAVGRKCDCSVCREFRGEDEAKAALLTLQRQHAQLQRLVGEYIETHAYEATTPRQNTLVREIRGLLKE